MTESVLQRLLRTAPVLQVGAVAALFIATAATISGYASQTPIYSTLVLAALLGIAAAGQTIVILIGGIDLSVPALISGANIVVAGLVGKGWAFLPACLLVLAGAIVVGVVAGFVTHRFRVPALIVTIATGAIVSGITLGWTSGGQVTGSPPRWLGTFSSPIGTVLGVSVPPVVVLWAALAVVLAIVLHMSALGHRLYATAANERAAVLAGVRTRRVWIGAFAFSAICSATAGILLLGFTGTGQTEVGNPYLFLTIAAVLVGGTSVIGGRGDYWRTVLGALIMILITTLLVGHGADEASEQMIIGALILLVVGVYGREARVRDRV